MAKSHPLGRSSENTKNSELTGLLSKLGLEAYFERTINLSGVEKPDIQVVKEGYYFIEAKQQPATIQDATAKAYKYQQSLKSNGVTPKAVFGVLYSPESSGPCEVIALLNDKPYFTRNRLENLERLAEWIYEFIVNPPIMAEPDTELTIKTLREIVTNITSQMGKVSTRDIENVFGGKSVFENILEYEQDNLPVDQMRRAAAFLLVNQLLFYRLLSKESKNYPDINEDLIRSSADLLVYFAKVIEKDYAAVFGFDVASKIPAEAIDSLRSAIITIKAITPTNLPHDIVGRIFHDLIPFEIRKSVAAFYTNNEAAEMLAALAIKSKDDKVADFACGSGTLLVAAYHIKKILLTTKRAFTEEDHSRFLQSDITGVDIMPFAAHLAAVNLSLQAPLYETEKVRIAVWDSTKLRPEVSIPALSAELAEAYKSPTLETFFEEGPKPRKYLKKGGISLGKEGRAELYLSPVDVTIMNPPFTRQERLPEKYKKELTRRFDDYGRYFSTQLNLHGYFMLLSDRFLKEGGRMAFVLPATTLRLRSFEGIKKLISEKYWLRYLVVNGSRSAFSESTQLREILLVAEKSEVKGETVIATIKAMPESREQAIQFAEYIKNLENNDFIATIKENQENVLENINRYLGSEQSRGEEILDTIKVSTDKLNPLDRVLRKRNAKIIRGIQIWKGDKIYAAKMFILFSKKRALKKQDEWYLENTSKDSITARNRINGLQAEIPKQNVIPSLRRFSGLGRIDISRELDYLVKNEFNKLNYFITEIRKTDLVKWEKDLENKKSNVIIVGRFDISASGTKSLAYYSESEFTPSQMFWLIKGMSDEDAKIFALFWNSSVNILQILSNKKETRGAFIQILAYSFKDFLVIDSSLLSAGSKEKLVKCFDEVSQEDLPSILNRYENMDQRQLKIDSAIFEALGVNYSDKQMKDLYSFIGGEIKKLKGVMK
ncbi:MAG: N-6 DNA methylase [Thermoplasmatales archaeon]